MLGNSIIRIPPIQIPFFWEVIKQTVVQADEVEVKDRPFYFNSLLHSLLNDKSQCFVRLNEEKRLLALMITKIAIDKITGDKSLSIQNLYSWKMVDDKEWQNDFLFFRSFAKKEDCKYVSFESRNPRVWQLGELAGFREKSRMFSLTLGV